MTRSLSDIAEASSSSRRLRRGKDRSEVIALPLEGDIILRISSFAAFSKDEGRRCLRPLAKNAAKKKPSRRLIVRGQRRPKDLPLSLSLSSSFFLVAARLIPQGSGRQRSESTILDLFQAVTEWKQPRIDRYGARSRVQPGSGQSTYWSAILGALVLYLHAIACNSYL
ncbi:hypothetical protein BHE74_00028379 [Ensete ventricosum]|nr:hypothetical protein GW17_00029765 [Ensete ventricosum]RWW64387.1 hypothetical protein BHE74_00028379 [Ensete ventricosum]